jgi:hypothetical protein
MKIKSIYAGQLGIWRYIRETQREVCLLQIEKMAGEFDQVYKDDFKLLNAYLLRDYVNQIRAAM